MAFTYYPDFSAVTGHEPKSIRSDGQTLWVGKWSAKHCYAYNLKDDLATIDTVEAYAKRDRSKGLTASTMTPSTSPVTAPTCGLRKSRRTVALGMSIGTTIRIGPALPIWISSTTIQEAAG